ncbi:MAG: tetratricopeptide repeat protein [Candidatus Binatia bacterium]
MNWHKYVAILALCTSGCVFSGLGQKIFAQDRRGWISHEPLFEEDLSPPGEAMSPGEKFDERIPEEEKDTRSVSPGDFDGTIDRELSSTLTSGPPDLPAARTLLPHEQVALSFVIRGREAMAREEAAVAKAYFERAIEIAPLLPFSYYFLGKLAFLYEKHEQALPLLQKAGTLLARRNHLWCGEALRLLGAVYEDMGEYEHARATYRQSLDFAPANLQIRSALARLSDGES